MKTQTAEQKVNTANSASKGYDSAKPDTAHADQSVETQTQADSEVMSLDQAVAIASEYLATIQDSLDQAVAYEWKKAAKQHSKAVGDKQAKAYQLRDSLSTAEASEYEAILDSLEAVSLEAAEACDRAVQAKATESEATGFMVLRGKGHLIDDPEFSVNQVPVDSMALNLVRMTRVIKGGQVSVLFKSTNKGVDDKSDIPLTPIGLITPSGIVRFIDIPNNQQNKMLFAKAEGAWCPNVRLTKKLQTLADTEQMVSKEFKNAGFSLADLRRF